MGTLGEWTQGPDQHGAPGEAGTRGGPSLSATPGALVSGLTMDSEVLVAAASKPKSEVPPGPGLKDLRRRVAIPGRRTRAGDKQRRASSGAPVSAPRPLLWATRKTWASRVRTARVPREVGRPAHSVEQCGFKNQAGSGQPLQCLP